MKSTMLMRAVLSSDKIKGGARGWYIIPRHRQAWNKKKTGMRLGGFKPRSPYDRDVSEHGDLIS